MRRRSTPIRRWPPWCAVHFRGDRRSASARRRGAQALRDWIAGDPAAALAMAPRMLLRYGGDRGHPGRASGASPAAAHAAAGLPVAAVAGVLLLAAAWPASAWPCPAGCRRSGEAASATPSARVTPIPTPSWRPALLAAYQEGCGEPLDRSELQGLSRSEAEAMVAEAVADCQDGGGGGKGKGKGHGAKAEGGREGTD